MVCKKYGNISVEIFSFQPQPSLSSQLIRMAGVRNSGILKAINLPKTVQLWTVSDHLYRELGVFIRRVKKLGHSSIHTFYLLKPLNKKHFKTFIFYKCSTLTLTL